MASRSLLALALLALVTAYRAPPVALVRPSPCRVRTALPVYSARSITLCAPPPEEDAAQPAPASPLAKARAWISKYAKIDKAQIASLGFDAFFTYGLVSNANGDSDRRLTSCSLRLT